MNTQVVSEQYVTRARGQTVGDLLQREQTSGYFAQACHATDPAAKVRSLNQVVLVNLPVADRLARHYSDRGILVQDLIQVARLGLVLAVRRFDPDLGSDFLSFAVPTIRGELKRHFRDRGWVVRPPRAVQELCPRIVDASSLLTQRFGRTPTRVEMATHLGVDELSVARALLADGCFAPPSLDSTLNVEAGEDGGGPWGARVGRIDPGLEWVDAKVTLAPLFRGLCERDRRVLRLRFVDEMTQEEIGEVVGVSQMQVSRILARILWLARNELAA
ncbi:RNA polymerase sigma factor SigF [Nocardioides baekrokdamisoli]|uniref:RNA polymerase sigma factor SigF n=1 Tax=Nocardioides baekrokdamisoli TaxID=1804624 RepID=A0A3G9IEL4_9ACTN|nr:sigma-70 family RNA polymerase sigma factor [Nocardioides baekrokdamisoli]BBH17430.1 RNA polymerase sigma factor SigF [Nocardioides baekrokdamisoli]